MRVLMIHISDLHFKKSSYFKREKIDKLLLAINTFDEIDSVLLICTGDFSNTNSKEEYMIANKFIGYFLHKLGEKFNKFVYFLPVPGNHDIELDKYSKMEMKKVIANLHDVNLAESLLVKELGRQNKYFDFISNNSSWPLNRNLEVFNKKINVSDNLKLNIQLINTAPFSMLDHFDKEAHYIRNSLLINQYMNFNLNITVMHHSSDWFHESIKEVFDRSIRRNTDILFVGHEHTQRSQIISEDGAKMVVSKGGVFNSTDIDGEASFNVLCYDSKDATIISQSFYWDIKDYMYLPENNIIKEKIEKKFFYNVSNQFKEEMAKDEKNCISSSSFFSYYVFPDIISEKVDKSFKEKINDIDDFIDLIDKAKYVSIIGDSDIGKTLLLKKIYFSLSEKKYTVFLKSEDFYNSNIKKIIKNAVQEQHPENNSFEKFEQLDIKERMILIDDFDKIKNEVIKAKLLQYLKSIFSVVIFTSSKNTEIDIKQKFEEEYSLEIQTFQIKKFTIRKRHEIVEKLAKLHFKELDIDEFMLNVENKLSSSKTMKIMGNTFLLNYFNQAILNSHDMIYNGKDNFNIIFETSLRNLIISNTNKEEVDEYFKILEKIADFSYSNRKESLSYTDVDNIIRFFNEDYEAHIKTLIFVQSMVTCKIFLEKDNQYVFTNKMYLSYFIAKNICFEIETMQSYTKFRSVLENICFGINADILLFIVYLRQNIQILSNIYEYAEKISKNWESLCFDTNNINCFSHLKRLTSIKQITEQDKDNFVKVREENEIKEIEKMTLKCEGLYDYNEEEILTEFNQALCVYKCTEILARAIASFNTLLTADIRRTFANGLYEFTDKFLYKFLEPIDKDFDSFCTFLYEMFLKKDESLNLEEVKADFVKFLLLFIITIYDNIAINATNRKSLNLLIEEAQYLNCNNQILKLSFLDNYNNEDKFLEQAIKLLKHYHKSYILFSIRSIIIKHIYNKNLNYKQEQRLMSLLSDSMKSTGTAINEKRIKSNVFKKKLSQIK